MIIVMFDAHKLDISDELKTVLDVLKPHQDKIRYIDLLMMANFNASLYLKCNLNSHGFKLDSTVSF